MKYPILIFLFLIALGVRAQNLVPNPSFENYKSCPFNQGQVDSLYYWYNPTNNSPDYFNSCFGGLDSTNGPGIPHNFLGFQNARTGDGYCGFYLYVDSADTFYRNPREYIATRLTDSLKKDTVYCVSFYVNLPNIYWFCVSSSIEAYFSKDSVYHHIWPGADTLGFNPQFKNDSNNYVTDTVAWKRINGTFKAAGGERYMIIGNFFSNKKTKLMKYDSSINSTETYVYIDDVSVYSGQCNTDTGLGTGNIKKKNFFNVYPNPSNGNFYLNYGITTNATVTMYDILGRIITTEQLNVNDHIKEIRPGNIANGLYFLQVIDNKAVLYEAKMVIAR